LEFANELLSLVEPAGLRELAAQARRWRGEALVAQKKLSLAREELRQALSVAEEIGRVRLAADLRSALRKSGSEPD
jgi:hypothetical protein